MIKRILKIIIYIAFFPMLPLSLLTIIPVTIYALGRYILTGNDYIEIVFAPIDWASELPYKAIKKFL